MPIEVSPGFCGRCAADGLYDDGDEVCAAEDEEVEAGGEGAVLGAPQGEQLAEGVVVCCAEEAGCYINKVMGLLAILRG